MINQRQRLLFRCLLVCGCCALLSGTGCAQFGGKQYQQWTAKEAEGLLINSPWAQTRADLVGVGWRDPQTAAANTAITIRLRSALPVRQALVRLRQLKNSYDKKSDSEKTAIDAREKPLLECSECADYYMVTMSPGPDSRSGIAGYLFNPMLTFDRLKLEVRIKNEKGETRELAKFTQPKFAEDTAVFFFPRLNSKGEPLVSPANRKLTITFDPEVFGWAKGIIKFEFDVAKMVINGQVVF